MSYQRCSICKEWGFTTGLLGHRCPPLWGARDLDGDYSDEWTPIYANTAEQAAEGWAQKMEPEEEGSIQVVVRSPTGTMSLYTVYAEMVLEYSAREEALSDEDQARFTDEEEDAP